mgnify:CR=1 FL=1
MSFLDREGWDALTINALATHLGTKGPSLYNHVDSLDDLRRTVRMHVIDDILQMLNAVGQGRTRDDAVMAMASAYRSLVELAKLGNRNLRKARSDGFRMTEVESEILTLEEVAAYLKAGKRTVYRLAQKGEIPAFKLGGTWRFRRSELDRWIAESINKKKPEAE